MYIFWYNIANRNTELHYKNIYAICTTTVTAPAEACTWGWRGKSLKLGWISVDRGDTTLTLTIPSSMLSRLQRICVNNNSKLWFEWPRGCFAPVGTFLWEISDYLFSFIVGLTLPSSMDSDLEAFSHNPTDGSFTALTVQLTVFTNYLTQLFLSY